MRISVMRREYLLLVLLFAVTAWADDAQRAAAVPPRTGQAVSHRDGDDGALQMGAPWPEPRFAVEGEDEVVTDHLTGLMWVRAPHALKGNEGPMISDEPGLRADAVLKEMFPLRGPRKDAASVQDLNELIETRAWEKAVDFCNELNYAGYDDWRLPNVFELSSLVDFGRSFPALPEGHPFLRIPRNPEDIYFSGTSAKGVHTEHIGHRYARSVSMYDGAVGVTAKTDAGYAWPARGKSHLVMKTGQTVSYRAGDGGASQMGVAWEGSGPRFTVTAIIPEITLESLSVDDLLDKSLDAAPRDEMLGMPAMDPRLPDEVVTDRMTGLMWVREPHRLEGNDGRQRWNAAIDFCNALQYGGYDDWRLPNVRELLSLISYGHSHPALPDGHPFTVNNAHYLASTTCAHDPDRHFYVHAEHGIVRNVTWPCFVWPVRGGRK